MLSTSSGLMSWSLPMSLQGVTTQNTIIFTEVFLSLSTTVNKRHRFTTVGYNVVWKNMILKETPKMKGFLKVSIQSFSNFSTALQLWISKWHIPFLPGLLIVVERNNFMSIPSFNGLWTDAYGGSKLPKWFCLGPKLMTAFIMEDSNFSTGATSSQTKSNNYVKPCTVLNYSLPIKVCNNFTMHWITHGT
jgi:hypothetical protein